MFSFVRKVVSNSSASSLSRRAADKTFDSRNLRLERLEDRAMLSVTPAPLTTIPEPELVDASANVASETTNEAPVTVEFDDAIVGAESEVGASSEEASPAAPSDLILEGYDATLRNIKMSWTDNSVDETGFRVEYTTNGGKTWLFAQQLGADATSRTAWGVLPNETYQFRVCALRGAERSDWAYSQELETTRNLEAPSDLTVGEYNAAKRCVELSWTDNGNYEAGFKIDYSTNGGKTWSVARYASFNATSATVWNVKPNMVYSFRISAYRGAEYTGWAYSDPAPTGELIAPSDLVLGKYDPETETLPMSWTDNSSSESGFRVEYTLDDGATWRKAEITDANVNSRVAWAVRPNATYQFRVCALRGSERSDWAYSEVLDTFAQIPAPSDLILGKYDPETETLPMSWTDNSEGETGFRVEYTLDGGKSWFLSEEPGADVTTRNAWHVHPNSTYQFRVCALVGKQRTAWTYSEVLTTGGKAGQTEIREAALLSLANLDDDVFAVEF